MVIIMAAGMAGIMNMRDVMGTASTGIVTTVGIMDAATATITMESTAKGTCMPMAITGGSIMESAIMGMTSTAIMTTEAASSIPRANLSLEPSHTSIPLGAYELESLRANEAELRFYAFDTSIRLRAFGRDERLEVPLLEALDACRQYEALFSRTLPRSDVWRINESHGEWVVVDPRTYELIEKAIGYCAVSHGTFDITVGALSRLWDFKRGIVPSRDALQDALAHIDWRGVELRANDGKPQVRLRDPRACIDLGGIAKGWIADALRDLLLERDIDAFVIDLGGNILVEGEKPNGEPWAVGLPVPAKGPRSSNEPISAMTITLRRGSIVTSGVYERSFMQDGVRFHHILDPRTGMPIPIEYPAVSVICRNSIDAEGFSTTLLALGPERSCELVAAHPEILQAFFISWDGTPHPLLPR